MQTVVGLFETRTEAEAVINRMQANGIGRDAVSVAMKDTTDSAGLSESTGAHDLSAEGATSGLLSGAGVGALVGLALVGSSLILPGIGTFLIGGPLAAALTGAGIGAASGGLIGGLIGSGIPEEDAKHFSTGLETGRIVVSAQVPDGEVGTIRRIFDEEGSTRTYAP